MEGERRKRKLEEEEENGEQKMERFFALIKSTRDARDLLCNSKEKTEKEFEEKKGKAIWNPTFQPEDFIGYEEFGKSNVSAHAAGPSEKEKEKEVVMIIEKDYLQEATTVAEAPPAAENIEEKERGTVHLDLNLTL